MLRERLREKRRLASRRAFGPGNKRKREDYEDEFDDYESYEEYGEFDEYDDYGDCSRGAVRRPFFLKPSAASPRACATGARVLLDELDNHAGDILAGGIFDTFEPRAGIDFHDDRAL